MNYVLQQITQEQLLGEQEFDELKNIYLSLTAFEQLVAEIYAAFFVTVSRADILTCVKVLHRDAQEIKYKDISSTANRLIESGLLLTSPSGASYCNPTICEFVTREGLRRNSGVLGEVQRFIKSKPISPYYASPRDLYWFIGEEQYLRDVRLALYLGQYDDIPYYVGGMEYALKKSVRIPFKKVLCLVFCTPIEKALIAELPLEYRIEIFQVLLDTCSKGLNSLSAVLELIESTNTISQDTPPEFLAQVIEHLLMCYDLTQVKRYLTYVPTTHQDIKQLYEAAILTMQGNFATAIPLFEEALALFWKRSGSKRKYFQGFGGIFFIIALMQRQSGEGMSLAVKRAKLGSGNAKNPDRLFYFPLYHCARFLNGDDTTRSEVFNCQFADITQSHLVSYYFFFLACSWSNSWDDPWGERVDVVDIISDLHDLLKKTEYRWLCLQTAHLLAKHKRSNRELVEAKIQLTELACVPFTNLIEAQEEWELRLKALSQIGLATTKKTASGSAGERRLIWTLVRNSDGSCEVRPKEQSVNKKGQWSKGRNIALKRLYDKQISFDYMTAQDERARGCVVMSHYGYYGSKEYEFHDSVLSELIEHPHVYDANSGAKLELVKGQIELQILKNANSDGVTLKLHPMFRGAPTTFIVEETPTRLQVYEVNREHIQIAEILQGALSIPEAGVDRVLPSIQALTKSLVIQSDISGAQLSSCEHVESSSIPVIHLFPEGEGLQVNLYCRPLGSVGPYYRPGLGRAVVIAHADEGEIQTTRKLADEKERALELLKKCPTLLSRDDGSHVWHFDEIEDCLELLFELRESSEMVVVEWPQGVSLQIGASVRSSDFNIRIESNLEWFSASGALRLDEAKEIELSELLLRLEHARGRFIPLQDGEYIALTKAFRNRLDFLNAFTEADGEKRRFHPLASFALDDVIEEFSHQHIDNGWTEHVSKLRDISKQEPQPPSTLRAELRDYQIEGFQWLSRLAQLEVGACLADDMGLGKTLQAIALILERASRGPSLIIAPTSVTTNWLNEINRFAPTLTPYLLLDAANREECCQGLKAGDVLIGSYGLLQQDKVVDILAACCWNVVVLDEAQAIKNSNTKRAHAVGRLSGQFRLALSGTPIENHLGELWSLFRFINPGLLGGIKYFNKRYADPIERSGDRVARQQLKRLIEPFILRRTKTQVLDELPSRTEITLHVELSDQEKVFYESLRRTALARLSHEDDSPMQILSEIMRLRRACCHPQLVDSELAISGAKLEVFSGLVQELIEGRHKVLVFSQFVGHLHIIREHLKQQAISFQYLDGATSRAHRDKAITAFQSGDGDVFLISLKAGGSGLNLTAADYVIHMDPWWNPAVEDQASDRAHRIGQQRPVTIYRLVTQGTIEEKIVELHSRKRDLADSLLEGTDTTGRITSEELLRLIQQE